MKTWSRQHQKIPDKIRWGGSSQLDLDHKGQNTSNDSDVLNYRLNLPNEVYEKLIEDKFENLVTRPRNIEINKTESEEKVYTFIPISLPEIQKFFIRENFKHKNLAKILDFTYKLIAILVLVIIWWLLLK